MKFTILAGAALTTLAAAAPAKPVKVSPVSSGTQQLATFEDLTTIPGAGELSPVGDYKGIIYREFSGLEAGVLGIVATGLVPHSGNKYIGALLTSTIYSTDGFAFIADGKVARSIDLQSLYFGCVPDTVQSATAVPQKCTVAFSATKRGATSPFDTINFAFNPTPIRSPLMLAQFPATWTDLSQVDITTVSAATGSELNAIVIDDVAYKSHK